VGPAPGTPPPPPPAGASPAPATLHPPPSASRRAFVGGKKYAKLVASKDEGARLADLEPFIVPSRNFEDRLYCALTGMLVARNLAGAQKHMQGRRFGAAKQRFINNEQELLPEPDLEEGSDAEMEGGEGGGLEMADGEEGQGMWVPEDAVLDSGGEDMDGAGDGEPEPEPEPASAAPATGGKRKRIKEPLKKKRRNE